MEKNLLELNSIKSDLSRELTTMYCLTKTLARLLRSCERLETKEYILELLNIICEMMEDNFIDMEKVYKELSNFISKISCEK